ncbi:MAG: hypothetical protein ACREHD_08970, partial [Pirellulales bacterium]
MPTRKPLTVLAVILFLSAGTLTAVNYRPAGVDMTQAARDFLAGLNAEQRTEATVKFDDPARLDWHFIPKDKR